MPRLRIYCFDGTWADRNAKTKNTLLAPIIDFISKGPDLEIKYYPGPGARSGLIEKYIGGGLATAEVTSTIIDAISDLATNYRPGDVIVVIGYSRGSYTGRSFIGFLDRVGLPKDADRHVLHDLYEKYTSGRFLKRGVASHLMMKYNCIRVEVKTLLCIDTVGALGIPHTGVFGFLKLLSPLIKKQQFMETNAASNVQYLLHVLALHESRGPFRPTLMQVDKTSKQTLHQLWCLGTHSGVAPDGDDSNLGDIVLAWCIANLELYAGIVFNEAKLTGRFERKGVELPLAGVAPSALAWHDPINDPVKGLWRLMGRHTRVPNRQVAEGKRTDESVHMTARLRGYGSSRGRPAVPGHCLESHEGSFVWKKNGSESSLLPEAALSDREARLLGIPLAAAAP